MWLLVCTCFSIHIPRFCWYAFEPQGDRVTSVTPSLCAPSQLTAATDSVWPCLAAWHTLMLQGVWLSEGAVDLWSLVALISVCISSGGTYCSVLQSAPVCLCVLVFGCSVWVLQPVVSAVVSVTLTASLSTQGCCHMLAASVRAEQEPWLRRESRLCVLELLMFEQWFLLFLGGAHCPLLTARNTSEIYQLEWLRCYLDTVLSVWKDSTG